MNFSFTEDQQMVIEEARVFAEKRLEPKVVELDEKGEQNIKALKELGELGYLGLTVPEKYGGTDLDYVAYMGAMLELSKVDAGTAVAVSVQNSLVNDALMNFGNDYQKNEYLPKLVTGQWIGCFALTEPNAGSDAGALRTTAMLKDGFYVLNGTKSFITNGPIADVAIVFAKTDADAGIKGISAFVIRTDTEGFSVGKKENKLGIRTSATSELIFRECKVPETALLGKKNKGLKIALTVLDSGRVSIAAQAVGIAEAALEEAVKYSKERIQFGKPISNLESIQFMLAEMATEVEVAKSMLYRVASMEDEGSVRYVKEASMLKLFSSEMCHRVCHKSLQIHGGYGFMKEYKIERLYRDQRITEIYEGTSEIQKLVIAKELLK